MELPCCLIPSRPRDDPLDALLLVGDLAMYTWGSALACRNYFRMPSPAGVPRWAQNHMALHLCHEIGRGAAFDLVRESRSSDLVIDAARRLVSGESLAQAADSLLERITHLPSEAADTAFALMNLWGDYLFEIDRRIMPKSLKARYDYMRGLLTYDEFCRAVYGEANELLSRLVEALRPQPRNSDVITINVHFSELGLGFFLTRATPAGLWQRVPLHEVAWHYGYVPAIGMATLPWPKSRSKHRFINICHSSIEREACQIVFPVATEHRAPVVAAALGRLAERAGGDPAEQLGRVRAAITDFILWHELGHLWSQQWIGRAASAPAYRGSQQFQWDTVREFYADCRAVRQFLHAGDVLAKDVFLLRLLRNVEPKKNLTPQLRNYHWPIARALLREDGLAYLTSLERTLRRMLGGVPLKSIDEWFGRQTEEAVADLRPELVG